MFTIISLPSPPTSPADPPHNLHLSECMWPFLTAKSPISDMSCVRDTRVKVGRQEDRTWSWDKTQ